MTVSHLIAKRIYGFVTGSEVPDRLSAPCRKFAAIGVSTVHAHRMLWILYLAGKGEAVLNSYEIRILKAKRPALIYLTYETDDLTAIRHAFSLLTEEDGIEVWRDLVCLYARPLPEGEANGTSVN